MVNFGGYAHYGADDMSKFLWFVRIAKSVDSTIEERDYYNEGTHPFGPGEGITDTFKNSLGYKLLYYRYGEVQRLSDRPTGFDRARAVEIAHKDYHLTRFREVYTSHDWITRVYEVLEPENRAPPF
jgi:hypothetical protein